MDDIKVISGPAKQGKREPLQGVKHKIMVMSGKGGVEIDGGANITVGWSNAAMPSACSMLTFTDLAPRLPAPPSS